VDLGLGEPEARLKRGLPMSSSYSVIRDKTFWTSQWYCNTVLEGDMRVTQGYVSETRAWLRNNKQCKRVFFMIITESWEDKASNQWRSEAKCLPGSTIKVPPFLPLKFAYKNLKWKKIMFSCLFKDIRIDKASWKSQSNTHKLKRVLFFIVDYESCFFWLSPPSSSSIFLFFAFFT